MREKPGRKMDMGRQSEAAAALMLFRAVERNWVWTHIYIRNCLLVSEGCKQKHKHRSMLNAA